MIRSMLLAACLLAAAPALAQDPVPPPRDEPPGGPPGDPILAPGPLQLSGEVELMSDYRFRGISRSDEDPAVQAGIMVQHDSGLYLGARGTSLRGNDPLRLRNPTFRDQGDLQMDLYAGYGHSLGGGFDLDAGLMYYAFAGGRGATDYAEPYASLSYLIGPLQMTGGVKYAPSQAATGRQDMVYLFGRADISVPFRPWSFSAEAGRQDWGAFGSYWNWSLGAHYHLRVARRAGADLGLRYVDTDLPAVHGQNAGLQATLAFSF